VETLQCNVSTGWIIVDISLIWIIHIRRNFYFPSPYGKNYVLERKMVLHADCKSFCLDVLVLRAGCNSFRFACKSFCLDVSVLRAGCNSFRFACKSFCLACKSFCLHVSVLRAGCNSFRLDVLKNKLASHLFLLQYAWVKAKTLGQIQFF